MSTSQLFFDGHMDEPQSVRAGGGEAVVISVRCPGKDGPNEDSAAVIPLSESRAVLAIADGMGGHSSGAEASRLALEALDASVRSGVDNEEELRTSILNGFEMANETVRAMGVGAGTTLAVVEIQGQWVRTYHAGDTGIVVVGQRGRIKTRTLDHSPTGYAVEAGMMNDREAIRHEERHIISNIVGFEDMRIDIGPSLKLAARDTALIASDGLFDNLLVDTVTDRIRTGPLLDSTGRLATAALRRMASESETRHAKPDDLTIVAFRRAVTRS